MKRSLRPFIFRLAGYVTLALGVLSVVKPNNANW